MPTLLHIDVSPRGDYSISRQLSAAFASQWQSKNPGAKVIRRDLAQTQLAFVDLPWIAGAYSTPDQHTPEQKQALKISDELIAELFEATDIVLGTPMYNFAIPASLKAWIDHIVRVGKTFKVDETGYHGLAGGRKVTGFIASGGDYSPGAPAETYNQEAPYLKLILGFLGITDVNLIQAGNTTPVAQGKVPMDQYLKPYLEAAKAAV